MVFKLLTLKIHGSSVTCAVVVYKLPTSKIHGPIEAGAFIVALMVTSTIDGSSEACAAMVKMHRCNEARAIMVFKLLVYLYMANNN